MKGAIGSETQQARPMTANQRETAARLYAQLYPGADVEAGLMRLYQRHADKRGVVTIESGRRVIRELMESRKRWGQG